MNKIIWAVDPTQKPDEALNLVIELKYWAKRLECEIQPVSVFSNTALNFPLELAFPWKERFESAAKKSLSIYMKKIRTNGFLPAEIIFSSAISTRKLASELVQYAEKERALLIFANTRAKKSWNPFRIGSFAETLLAISKIPVLVFTPTSRPSIKKPNILLPTDFSRESKAALLQIEPWAKALDASIQIYSQVEIPDLYATSENYTWQGQTLDIEAIIKRTEKRRMKKAKEWSNYLNMKNITCSWLIKKQEKFLSTEILDLAKKNKSNLIVLTSRSGPISQALLGSVARDVLLQAKCPVLVFHQPKSIQKELVSTKTTTPRKGLNHSKSLQQEAKFHE